MSLLHGIHHLQDKAVNQYYEKIKNELCKKIEDQPFEKCYDIPTTASTKLKEIIMKRFADEGLIVSCEYHDNGCAYGCEFNFRIPINK